jgi:antitoxin component YwqK of YwqJK toxin-antitoxin module
VNARDLLNLTFQQKIKGVWLSGIEGEGEYKKWYENGKLDVHCFYNDRKLNGEYKHWNENGQLLNHCFYKQGKKEGEYKSWYDNGQLAEHCFYRGDDSAS